MSSYVQSLLFDKNKYTLKHTEDWIKNNKYKPIKQVHETKNYYRYRISKPNYKKYRMLNTNEGIKIILGFY